MDKYGYIGIETLLNFCENSKDHSVTPNDFMRMKRVRMPERKKGKWIVYVVSMLDGEDCKCSECGQTSCAPYWNFCPNCGAKMEEPEDIPMEYFESGGR